MTTNEQRLLRYHNVIFTKQAKEASIFDVESIRFYVTYADGTRKYDYECGSFAEDIRNHVEGKE